MLFLFAQVASVSVAARCGGFVFLYRLVLVWVLGFRGEKSGGDKSGGKKSTIRSPPTR